MVAEKAVIHGRWFLKIYSLKFCDIWQNFYFYRILNNENFKMEVEETVLWHNSKYLRKLEEFKWKVLGNSLAVRNLLSWKIKGIISDLHLTSLFSF